MKANLKINKEIIEGFYNYGDTTDKSSFYVSKLKEENAKMITQLEKVTQEKDELRQKVFFSNIVNLYWASIEWNLNQGERCKRKIKK